MKPGSTVLSCVRSELVWGNARLRSCGADDGVMVLNCIRDPVMSMHINVYKVTKNTIVGL